MLRALVFASRWLVTLIHDPPAQYLTSIRTIEAATHLDFFAVLPDDEKDVLEEGGAAALWQ